MMRFDQYLPPRWQNLMPYFLLTLAVFAAYCNVYSNEFLFDDGLIITRNELLRHWSTFGQIFTSSTTQGAHIAGGFYRPVQILLYFLVYQISGESVFSFHLLNISIHAANACLLFALTKRLRLNHHAGFFAALIWALHPLHTEAVTYMSATADVLFVTFCLAGIVYLLPDIIFAKILKVTPVYILALLTKETAVVFPLLIICCYYFFGDKKYDTKTYLRTWPLWLITIAFVCWRLTASYLDGPESYNRIYQNSVYHSMQLYADHAEFRIYTFLATLPSYLQLIAWPADLHMERTFPIFVTFWIVPVLLGAGLLLLSLGQIIFNKNPKFAPLNWGLAWFGAAHFPDTGILIAINSLFLEHWMYLPTAGLFAGLGQTIYLNLESYDKKWQSAAYGVCIAIALTLGSATFLQNRTWHDPVTFYMHLFHYGISSARAHNNLALAYIERKEYDLAIEEYHKAIATSDTYAETHHNLAISLLSLPGKQSHEEEAIAELNRALEIDPNFYRSYIVLSQIYANRKDGDKADLYREKAEKILNSYPH